MALLDLLFPAECAGCGRPGGLSCRACVAPLTRPPRLAWPRPAPGGLPPPWAVSDYDGACRQFLLAYKERGAVGLGRVLGAALGSAVISAAGAERVVLLVPIPSSRAAIRDRGDDVVLALTRNAAATARRHGRAVRTLPALRHRRRIADSAGLAAAARVRNLAGAYTVSVALRPQLATAVVVIADDLITTGATLAEAATTLRAAGATVVGAAAVAATRRRGDSGLLGAVDDGATVEAIRYR